MLCASATCTSRASGSYCWLPACTGAAHSSSAPNSTYRAENLGTQLLLHPGCNLIHSDTRRRRITAALILDLAFFQTAIADGDAMRYANQFPVGKHGTGAFAAIVKHDIDTARLQGLIQR